MPSDSRQHAGRAAERLSTVHRVRIPDDHGQGNPHIVRTSFGAQKSMPRIGAYLADELGIKNVAVVWANTQFGKGGHDAFIEVAGNEGIEIVAGIPTEQAQVDFAADVTKVKSSSAERSSSI